MGETCGIQLVWEKIPQGPACALCLDRDKKLRRYEKTSADYARWVKASDRRASAEKAAKELRDLAADINKLNAEILAKRDNIGANKPRTTLRVSHDRASWNE